MLADCRIPLQASNRKECPSEANRRNRRLVGKEEEEVVCPPPPPSLVPPNARKQFRAAAARRSVAPVLAAGPITRSPQLRFRSVTQHGICITCVCRQHWFFSPFLFGGNEIDVKKGLREKRENRVVCYNCRQETRTHSARGNRDITLLWLMTSAWTLPFLLPQPPTSSYHPPCLCWFHFHQNVQFASRHHSHRINKWSCTFLSSSPPEKKYKTVLI